MNFMEQSMQKRYFRITIIPRNKLIPFAPLYCDQATPRPANLLEEIICDSDLDYLGRSDFIPVSNTLFEELKPRTR